MDVACGLVEVATNIEGLVVLGGHVEEIGHFGLWVGHLHALGSSEEGAHLQF